MKRGKRFSLFFAWVVLTMNMVLAMAVPALADMGRKPSVHLEILNAPSEEFCVALFTQGEPHKEEELKEYFERREKDAFTELKKKIFTYEGNGYHVDENPMDFFIKNSDDFWYKDYDYFSFTYYAPSTFKVCIVTKDNCVFSQQEITKTRYEASVVFDYKTGELYEDLEQYAKDDKNYVTKSIYFFLATIVIEGFFLLVFGLISVRNFIVFLIMNLLTQSYLHLYSWRHHEDALLHGRLWIADAAGLFGVEIVIAAVETVVYAIAMKEEKGRRWKCIAYGIVANLISAFFGILLP